MTQNKFVHKFTLLFFTLIELKWSRNLVLPTLLNRALPKKLALDFGAIFRGNTVYFVPQYSTLDALRHLVIFKCHRWSLGENYCCETMKFQNINPNVISKQQTVRNISLFRQNELTQQKK